LAAITNGLVLYGSNRSKNTDVDPFLAIEPSWQVSLVFEREQAGVEKAPTVPMTYT